MVVNANNVFNSVNRLSTLHSICRLCPSLAIVLINSYRSSTELFADGDVLYSSEGTTQGDPLAAPMYALAIIPHIKNLHCHLGDDSQVWCTDDASAVGKIDRLREWWSQFANATKTWLVMKEKYLATAAASFANNTGVQLTSEGRP